MNLVCTACNAVNRVPKEKLGEKPVCGRCKQALLPGKPLDLTDSNFTKFISRTELPVLVDFWAPWCGPCRMMAPAFAEAAAILSPQVLLAKLNTESSPQIASQFSISAIPTMILFKNGQQSVQQSGALNTSQIVGLARGGKPIA